MQPAEKGNSSSCWPGCWEWAAKRRSVPELVIHSADGKLSPLQTGFSPRHPASRRNVLSCSRQRASLCLGRQIYPLLCAAKDDHQQRAQADAAKGLPGRFGAHRHTEQFTRRGHDLELHWKA